MRDGYWPGSRRPRQRVALIVTPLVITMAVGLIIGIRYVSGTARLTLSSQGNRPGTAAPVSAGPARSRPSAAAASCDLIVPPNPLTAQGLATPYQLAGPGGRSPQAAGCAEGNPASSAFVQATILDPATGALSVYEPLVVSKDSAPAAAPAVPAMPAGAVVVLDFGFNGTSLTLRAASPATLTAANCVNGGPGPNFGRAAFCNGVAFFAAAKKDFAAGLTAVPATGVSAKTGQACPTTRSFTLVDQDPGSDVTTQYLVSRTGQTAQDSTANAAALGGSTVISNGGADVLLNGFLDPALGCNPFTAPDLSNGGAPGTSQALDELSAATNQRPPIALVPESDPMTLAGQAFSAARTNTYRASVSQPPVMAGQAADTPAAYCLHLVNMQGAFLARHQALLAAAATPATAVGGNLFTFLANRLSMSFTALNCHSFGLANPVMVTLTAAGAASAATVSARPQALTTTAGTAGAANPAAAQAPQAGQVLAAGWTPAPVGK